MKDRPVALAHVPCLRVFCCDQIGIYCAIPSSYRIEYLEIAIPSVRLWLLSKNSKSKTMSTQFRDILPREMYQNDQLLKVYLFCISLVAEVERDLIIGSDAIHLKPFEVPVAYDDVNYFLAMDNTRLNEALDKLQRLRKIEIRVQKEDYFVVKVCGISFPLTSTMGMPPSEDQVIPIEFDDWRKRDNEYVRNTYSQKYAELSRIVLDEFSDVIGRKYLHKINREDYDEYVRRISRRGVKDVTVNNYTRVLKASMNRALERQFILSNPFEKIKARRISRELPVVISVDEMNLLLKHIKNPILQGCVCFAMASGMRRGEITFLRWEDVDEEDERIIIRSSEEYRTKFKKERAICYTPIMKGTLACVKKYCEENEIQSEFVFPNPKGRHYHPNYLLKAIQVAANEAGFGKKIQFHTFRRSFASLMKRSGVKTDIIGEVLGHASEKTTRLYLRVFEDDVTNAMYSLDLTGGKNVETLLLQNT